MILEIYIYREREREILKKKTWYISMIQHIYDRGFKTPLFNHRCHISSFGFTQPTHNIKNHMSWNYILLSIKLKQKQTI